MHSMSRDMSEERLELVLRALALDELADLAADRGEHLEQVLVGLADLAAEELEHAEHDRRRAGSAIRTPRAAPRARRPAARGKLESSVDVSDPGRLAARPHAAGQPDAAREGVARLTASNSGTATDGGCQVSTQRIDLPGRVHGPDRPVVQAQRLADRLQDAGGRLRERGGLGQRAGVSYWTCSCRTASAWPALLMGSPWLA